MKKASVLFAIISLVGVDVVLGQIYAPSLTLNTTTNNASPTLNYVGIGTAKPAEMLDVTGTIKASTGMKVGTVFSVNSTGDIASSWGTYGGGTSYSIALDTYKASATNVGTFVLGEKAKNYGLFFGNGTSDAKNYNIFNTTNYALLFGTNNLERMRIDASGKVGIGTIAPVYGLDLNMPATATDAWLFNRARMSELVLGGAGKTNNWLFHRPDDGRTSFYIVPVTQGTTDTQWGYNWGGGFEFKNDGTLNIKNLMASGNVGIGLSTSPTEKLHIKGNLKVEGKIAATEVCVNATAAWCDYVFEPDYRLMPLNQLQSFIQKNKHLPEIPSSAEVEKDGISLSKMVTLQMKKIEEMTLYILEMEARMKKLENKK